MNFNKLIFYTLAAIMLLSCSKSVKEGYSRYDYPNILDISYTPNDEVRCGGWFTDAGSWWGFTLPQKGNWVNGFCGPFHLDMNKRVWFSQAIVKAGFETASGNKDNFNIDKSETFIPDSLTYFPGELYVNALSKNGNIEQRLIFIDKNNALLQVQANGKLPLILYGDTQWNKKWFSKSTNTMELSKNSIIVKDSLGEGFALTFNKDVKLLLNTPSDSSSNTVGYIAKCAVPKNEVVITFFTATNKMDEILLGANEKLLKSKVYRQENLARWNGYFKSVIREDMPMEYNRIAAKSITTLIANWKSARGDLHYDGVVPSHAVGYFMGFWGWDSWKHAVALASFAPNLAKDQVRAMFDYQDKNGMVIDCIYSDKKENNNRDSKPPLAAWAVSEIYKATGDSSFVKEIYPKLVSYFYWWFKYRDNNKNGICEFGSCDGTLEAAAWESGMDNAIRFDDAKMVYNGKINAAGKIADDSLGGWSINQESVDLNAFLVYEHKLLGELKSVATSTAKDNGTVSIMEDVEYDANVCGPAIGEPYPVNIADYFFSKDEGFFFDKKLDGAFVAQEGTEACIPLWAKIATKKQADDVAVIFTNSNKFATYIPFPTIAADNPKFMPAGYWRGPIWLDQVYFGINGLRKYGYTVQADTFTKQVFDRLYGLKEGAPIHENYNTHNGSLLKAPHFSWSSAHLLMLYLEYGK
ncbi:MAG: glycoside hydrolase [Bacteroidales bacterium]